MRTQIFLIKFYNPINPSGVNKSTLTEKLNIVLEEMIKKIIIDGYGLITGGNKLFSF